jgi:DNA-binding PadR family transcriptional regulator
MQFLILGILLDGPRTLYDVHKRFGAGISLFYAASFGSIQRALRQLETQGWACAQDEQYSPRRRRLYAITEEGRRTWRNWMTSPLTGSDPEPMMLARVYLLGHLPADERAECIAAIRARITADRSALSALAVDVDGTEPAQGAADLVRYRRATLDYGLRSHELALSWLDEVDA